MSQNVYFQLDKIFIDHLILFPDDDKSIPNISPLFISVDPERDNVEAMKNYVKGRSCSITLLILENFSCHGIV